jgi:hypothetical protein
MKLKSHQYSPDQMRNFIEEDFHFLTAGSMDGHYLLSRGLNFSYNEAVQGFYNDLPNDEQKQLFQRAVRGDIYNHYTRLADWEPVTPPCPI